MFEHNIGGRKELEILIPGVDLLNVKCKTMMAGHVIVDL